MMTVSELFIYKSLNMERLGFNAIVHVYEQCLHILEQEQNLHSKYEVKRNLLNTNMKIN